jgi:murein L,D-transpeptidase YcbB/YkuD
LRGRASRFLAGLLLVGAQTAAPLLAYARPPEEVLREQIEEIRASGTVSLGSGPVTPARALATLYEQRGFRPAWGDPARTRQLLDAIRAADQDGLQPSDYHLGRIEHLLDAPAARTGAGRAELDLLQTDALVRLASDLYFGRLDPERLDPSWNLTRETSDPRLEQALARVMEAGDLQALLAEARPRHPLYGQLREALAQYRALAAAGGWPTVPPGPKLQKGDRGERVVALRKRLAVTGDGPALPATGASHFDRALEDAVKGFQRRHGLGPDGVVGAGTFEALNVPAEARVEQVRANLERARWVLREVQGDFVIVDIAGFRAAYIRDGEVVWESRVQVGTPYRQTPSFKSEITYLVLNPNWTVPPTILAKDILPEARRDPGEIQKRGLKVLDREGRPVDPGSVDWSRYKASNFPYLLRQDPGPKNALGRMKFMFPNRYHIYLHDTPKKSLFDKPERAFSSGCIRIEKPLELAELLMESDSRWSRERITAAIDSRTTRTVFLPRPVPILLLYWTVSFDEAGRIGFKKDIYERDRAVLEALGQDIPAPRAAERVGPPTAGPADLTWVSRPTRPE